MPAKHTARNSNFTRRPSYYITIFVGLQINGKTEHHTAPNITIDNSEPGDYTLLTALIEIHYLPCIAYFSAVYGADEIQLERCEHYVKQTYRNRCQINSANGKIPLVVPVSSKHGKTLITDVRLDYTQKWINNHWRTLQSAYGNAPFFEHYAPDLHDILFRKVEFLYELNYMLLSMCLGWLEWSMPIKETNIYADRPAINVLDLRFAINAKKLEQCHQFYYPVMYNQVFGNTFVENLSLIDLVFCEGPRASSIVQGSAIQKMNK